MPTSILLADVRAHLRMPASYTADDTLLTGIFIPAATDALRREVGDIIPKQYDEYHNGGEFTIYLRQLPVLSVENVVEGWGWIDYILDFVQVTSVPAASMFAYSLDDAPNGMISRRSAGNVNIPFVPGNRNVYITYTAGRNPIPPAIYLACLELIAHWYQNALQRAGAGSGNAYAYDSVNADFPHSGSDIYTSINQGVPYRILQMIKSYRRLPIIG